MEKTEQKNHEMNCNSKTKCNLRFAHSFIDEGFELIPVDMSREKYVPIYGVN